MSESHKGTTVATSTREKLSRSLAGRQLSQETRLRIAASQQKRWQEKKRQRELSQTAAATVAAPSTLTPFPNASSFPSSPPASLQPWGTHSRANTQASTLSHEAVAVRADPPGTLGWDSPATPRFLPAWASLNHAMAGLWPGHGPATGGLPPATLMPGGAAGGTPGHSQGVNVHAPGDIVPAADSVFNLAPRTLDIASTSPDREPRIPNANAPYLDQVAAPEGTQRRRDRATAGRRRSDATRRKISAAMVGRRHSAATRAKISVAMREHQRQVKLRRLLMEERSRNQRPPSEQIASYKQNLRRYNTLREELQNWSDAFRQHNGRRPT
eukprot:jgi/Mesvir1/6755/Mv24254-RA.1